MKPNEDDRRKRRRPWMRIIDLSWDDILTGCEEEFGEDNIVMVEKVERKIPNWTRNPFSVWVVIYLNDFPHPILYEVKHPRFGVAEENESNE